MRLALSLLAILSLISVRSAVAQPVGAGSGPLSEVSRPLRDDSRPVHERGRSVRDGTVGSMKSGPVRGERRVGMLSGPVSEVSVGPVTAGRPMTGGGSMTENSAGAVKHEMDHSLGEQVYDLQRALGPLQERMRLQAEADAAAALDDALQDEAGQQENFETESPEDAAQVQLDESESAVESTGPFEPAVPADAVDEGPAPTEDEPAH